LCAVTHVLLPCFVLAGRLDVAETVGTVIAEVLDGPTGVRPAAKSADIFHTMASRSAAQIASILYYRLGIMVAGLTIRAQLHRRGGQRKALLAEPKVFGRYKADGPNEHWITDVLVRPLGGIHCG
jgi:hypothetical protein